MLPRLATTTSGVVTSGSTLFERFCGVERPAPISPARLKNTSDAQSAQGACAQTTLTLPAGSTATFGHVHVSVVSHKAFGAANVTPRSRERVNQTFQLKLTWSCVCHTTLMLSWRSTASCGSTAAPASLEITFGLENVAPPSTERL